MLSRSPFSTLLCYLNAAPFLGRAPSVFCCQSVCSAFRPSLLSVPPSSFVLCFLVGPCTLQSFSASEFSPRPSLSVILTRYSLSLWFLALFLSSQSLLSSWLSVCSLFLIYVSVFSSSLCFLARMLCVCPSLGLSSPIYAVAAETNSVRIMGTCLSISCFLVRLSMSS